MPTKTTKRPLKAEDLYDLQFVEDPQISPDGKRVAFVKMTMSKLPNKYERHIWLADLSGSQPRVRQFTFGDKNDTSPRWSPDGKTLAFVSAREPAIPDKPQICLIGVDGGEARPITKLGNGATNPAWSADGRRIAFLGRVNAEEREKEDSGKEDPKPDTALEVRHLKERREEDEKKKADPRIITRLPYRTGTEYYDDRRSHIYVMDLPTDGNNGKPYRITDGELDFTVVEWSPDGKYIYSTQSRTPDYSPWEQLDIIRINATGKRRPFTRLTQPGFDYLTAKPSPDGKWLAVIRHVETGSWGHTQHLCIMPANGGAAKPLTVEFDRNPESFEWGADSKTLFFTAGDRGDTGLYRVAASGGVVTRVVGGRRMILGFSRAKSGRAAFVASTPERPVDLHIADGKSEKQITDFNRKLLDEVHVAKTEEMQYTAPDGREIQGWLIKPHGFKPGRKYPLAVNMHGGPHVMWGPGMPSMWIEWQFHAARGYAVFYCNPRGSDGYGDEFASVIQSEWGDDVMHDVLTGVDRVVDKGFVDTKRMALTGGSYAGYMTAWIVGHEQRFACAWSQRGLYSLMSFYGTSDIPQLLEREFDLEFPGDDPEKSWQHSPLAYAKNIKTPLAIEHQEDDYRCPVSDAEQLFTTLKKLKREVVFYRYPREGHEMSRSGEPQHRVDRLNRMVEWFERWCKKR